MSHEDDDTAILDGAGVPTILNAGNTGIVRGRNAAQVCDCAATNSSHVDLYVY